jgi:hypothetical protein
MVGSAGDSLLVELASAVDAVQCAKETDSNSPPEIRPKHGVMFRIAIKLGDVIAEGSTI